MIIKTLGMAHQPTAISWAKLKTGNLEKSVDFDTSEFSAATAIYVRHGDDFDEILEIFEKNANIQNIHENLGLVNPLFVEKLFAKLLTMKPGAILQIVKLMARTPSKFSLRNFFRRCGSNFLLIFTHNLD